MNNYKVDFSTETTVRNKVGFGIIIVLLIICAIGVL